MIVHSLVARVGSWHADRQRQLFDRSTIDVRRAQDEQLLSVVRANQDTDFGRAHGFGGIRGYDDFCRQVPITTYEYYREYVQRVMAGQVDAMFGSGQQVRMFAMTSGTTGKAKYLPVTQRFIEQYRAGWNIFGIQALRDHPDAFFRGILQITSDHCEQRSESGLPCGAITGLLASTQKWIVRRHYVVSPMVARIADPFARAYVAMRLAVPCDVAFSSTASPATMLRLARLADEHSEQLIRDVRDGTIDTSLDVPDEVRRALLKVCAADADTAGRLEHCRQQRGRLLPKDYWRLSFMANWTGGTMGLYLQQYEDYFGSVPVRDIGLLASEGRMTIPLTDGTSSGVLAVQCGFFEFIPESEYGDDRATVVRADDLEPGRSYYILLTTSGGLYRYDIGDVVRCDGMYESPLGGTRTPMLSFLHKGSHIASVTGEKLSEHQVVSAARQVDALAGVDTFVVAPAWDDPPYYRLYVEHDGGDMDRLERAAGEYDAMLCRENIEYSSKRSSNRLGPVRVVVVPSGTLQQRDARLAHRRGREEQFKHQYLLTQIGQDSDIQEDARICS